MSTTPQKPMAEKQVDPLSSVLSQKLFPGRTRLMVMEVARALRINDKHVVSLINEGLLDAVEITGKGNKSSRGHWRVPVSAYDDYIRRRRSSAEKKSSPK